MVKEAARKCSCCGHNGHNSRTCSNKGCIKLFGAIIEKNEHTIKRSASMGNLVTLDDNNIAHHHVEAGYNSDGDVGSKRGKGRKKGKPWTEAEHRTFLAGLNKLGKGDWRGISKNFVTTRSPSQVASHAQKYFMRQAASPDKKKRRSSLFDMTFKESDLVPAPKLPFIKTSGSILQARFSSASPLKNAGDISVQANQLINRFPSLCLDNPHMLSPPIAAAGVPNYNPYMQGVPANGYRSFLSTKAMMAAPFVSMMNHSRVGYQPDMPRSPRSLAACASFTAHPSGVPSPRSFPHTFVPESSATRKEDPLELKIGQPPPQPTQGANLSSPSSGAISVI